MPRKPNWDLKRDVERKLARLQKTTARAVAELVRDRVAQEAAGASAALSDKLPGRTAAPSSGSVDAAALARAVALHQGGEEEEED